MDHITEKRGKGRAKAEGGTSHRSAGGERSRRTSTDLEALRRAVDEAASRLASATARAAKLEAEAQRIVSEAKAAYREAALPYRDACRHSGTGCELSRMRSANVSDRVTFLASKVAGGIKVTVKGRPETEELIPAAKLRVSVGKSAEQYCERWIGARSVVGNKQGSLGNLLRAVLKEKAK